MDGFREFFELRYGELLRTAYLHHAIDEDQTLLDVLDLPVGHSASRTRIGGPSFLAGLRDQTRPPRLDVAHRIANLKRPDGRVFAAIGQLKWGQATRQRAFDQRLPLLPRGEPRTPSSTTLPGPLPQAILAVPPQTAGEPVLLAAARLPRVLAAAGGCPRPAVP